MTDSTTDQGGHAQRHADQGEDRDEGDEALALAGRQVTPGEPAFDGGRGVTHGATLRPDRAARPRCRIKRGEQREDQRHAGDHRDFRPFDA